MAKEKTLVVGRYGRTSPAPHGSIYVRDAAAAAAAAVREKVELFESQGLEVPEFLAAQAAEAVSGDPIVLVEADAVTQDSWRLIGEGDAEDAADEVAVESAPAETAEVVDVEESAEVEVVEEAEEAPKPRRRTKKATSSEA